MKMSGGVGTPSLRDLHPIYREALCVWEAFRRTGFGASEIYVGRKPTEGHFVVALPHLQYGWVVIPPETDPLALAAVSPEDLVRDWQAAAEMWNAMAARQDPELLAAWEASSVRRRSAEFVAAMVSHGIALPCTADC